MDLLTFIILAILMVGSAVAVVLHPSPVYSALSLVVVMSLLAVYFLFLNAHVVGALQIIVYAGAVMVLFLFVIMLLNLQTDSRETQQSEMKTSAGILCAVLIGELSIPSRGRGRAPRTPDKPAAVTRRVRHDADAERTAIYGLRVAVRDYLGPLVSSCGWRSRVSATTAPRIRESG